MLTKVPAPLNCNWSPGESLSPSSAITPNSKVTGPASGVTNPEIGISKLFPILTFAKPS